MGSRGAGLGSSRPVHSREHGQLKQQRSPVVGRESSGGCGALARRWLLGRGLAWGGAGDRLPHPPAGARPFPRSWELVLMVGEGMGLEIGAPGGSQG